MQITHTHMYILVICQKTKTLSNLEALKVARAKNSTQQQNPWQSSIVSPNDSTNIDAHIHMLYIKVEFLQRKNKKPNSHKIPAEMNAEKTRIKCAQQQFQCV